MAQTKHQILNDVIAKLSDREQIKTVAHELHENISLPSEDTLKKIVTLVRAIIFPGYFGNSAVNSNNLSYHIGISVEQLLNLLTEQIQAGLSFDEQEDSSRKNAANKALSFIQGLPSLRELLTTDVIAAYNGDPAAKSFGEIIFCYPAIRAIGNYRIAHLLLQLGVPIIPRIITEMAHSETGIDIHPGATIGAYFTIDHGTGVVIGETSIIGKNVKLYQGVTLGAKSFPLDEKGLPIKGIPRHPVLEDDVIVYSNSSILGRITIGKGAVIGGNVWVETDVAPNTKILQKK